MFITFFVNKKISYYLFNRLELLQKAKVKYHNCSGKEETPEYFLANKDTIKQRTNDRCKNLTEELKEAKKKISSRQV